MHPALVNLFHGLADKIDEDPEKFERKLKTLGRRLKKRLKSKEFERELRNVTLRVIARKIRSL